MMTSSIFEWLSISWLIAIVIGLILMYRSVKYYHASEKARKMAANSGMFRIRKDPLWARIYRALSCRREARLIGTFSKLRLPIILRRPVLTAFMKWTDTHMEDVEEQDLTKYESVNDFFLRKVNQSARPIAGACLVSPADCYTAHFGVVDENRILHDIKGYTYNFTAFFGEDIAEKLDTIIEQKNDTALWFFMGFLSPADCHHYYSPVDVTLKFRRHFTGRLIDEDVFDINERMLVTGEWKYGFFSFTAVGATHVGDINFDFDERHTNIKKDTKGTHDDKVYDPPVKKRKGQYFGHFEIGSAIALVFQAPLSFKFSVSPGQKLQFGQAIGDVCA